MKRIAILGVSATVLLALACGSSHAQFTKVLDLKRDVPKDLFKFTQPDLAVVAFSGAFDGTNYHVGGTVKNVGNATYSRTRSITGAFQGRQVQLFAVTTTKTGQSLKLLRTMYVPTLQPNQTYATPSMTVSPRDVPGPNNARFLLKITAGDGNSQNDSKQIDVSVVR
jgi:hypothetical protein